MSRIQWMKLEEKSVQLGLDRGVLYPSAGSAVPWNGLVSVSESGSQQSASYYIDGQRFLSTASPRDFGASLTAYTFPDEFAEICGIVEAADGLFLDSQVPDQFGLCYRTMYGNDKNYKIHLVYAATAAMSDTQYQTLSDGQNDPSVFEFDLLATPQLAPGFRPTAHVVIDTRNLTPLAVANIENLIYGTWNQDPYLPSIAELYEMMNYGDEVNITDNGDGTWTADGSYRYIDLDEDTGLFTIKNVVVVDHGNSTYDVSDTA